MEKRRLASVIVFCSVMGTLFCTSPTKADFHEDFEGPSIDLSNWTIMDIGGLDAVQANGRLYVNGTYDPGETVPYTGGWNHYRLIYKDNFTGFLDISATDSISIMTGTEIAVGIGLMLDNTVGWDNITSWAQYWYSSTNAIGWMNSWEGGVNTELIFDDTDITQFTQHTHRMIHHENNTVQFLLDGVTKGWHTLAISSFYPTIEVGIHAGSTHLEAVFDSFHLITDPPTSIISASNTNPDKQEQIVLDGNNSFYEGAQIVSYLFDFGDGNSTGWISNPFAFYSYPNEGLYDAKLKVRGDNGKESNWSSIALCVGCDRPNASLEADPLTLQTLEIVNFSANQSTDSDGTILGYYFDYGDRASSGWIMSSYASHSYSDNGTYSARLKVLDNDGFESNWTEPLNITVLNRAPVPRFWYSSDQINQGEFVTFDGGRSFDSDGWVEFYDFDFGDGTGSGWTNFSTQLHIYYEVGDYRVSLRVADDDGTQSTFSSVHYITVVNSQPTAIVTVFDPEIPPTHNAIFNASYSYDPDGAVDSYFFDFGDGTDSGWITSHTTGHIYLDEGVYDITVKVRDDDGAESMWSTAVQILVERRLPHPALNSTTIEVFEGEEVFLSGQFSEGFDGHIRFWIFDFGDGSITGWISTPHTTHVYLEAGEYIVTLRVRDSLDGESVGVNQLTIHVMEEEDALDAGFNWWIVIAVVMLALWLITLLITLTYRSRIRELEEESESIPEISEDEGKV